MPSVGLMALLAIPERRQPITARTESSCSPDRLSGRFYDETGEVSSKYSKMKFTFTSFGFQRLEVKDGDAGGLTAGSCSCRNWSSKYKHIKSLRNLELIFTDAVKRSGHTDDTSLTYRQFGLRLMMETLILQQIQTKSKSIQVHLKNKQSWARNHHINEDFCCFLFVKPQKEEEKKEIQLNTTDTSTESTPSSPFYIQSENQTQK